MVRKVISRVAILSLLALAACSEAMPPVEANPSAAVTAEASATPTPSTEPTEGTLCAEFPSREPSRPADDLEGWWNATPVDPQTGEAILDPTEWDDARMREHPRVAVVDTQSGYWVTWDRTICGQTDEYGPAIQDDWPPLSYAIVDIDSGEVLESLEIAAVGDGVGLTTTTSALATVLANGGVMLGPEEAASYTELVLEAQDPDFGLEFTAAASVIPEVLGGTYESSSGVGFMFRTQRGSDLSVGEPMSFQPEPLEIDGGEGRTFGGPTWGFAAEAVATAGDCAVSVHALPVDVDVPPWPEGYGEYLSTTVLPRLLASC